MASALASIPGFDLVMAMIAAAALLLVIYLGLARRRLARLRRAEEVAATDLSPDEVGRILELARALLAGRARQPKDETSP